MSKSSSALAIPPAPDFFDFKADASLPQSFAQDYLRQYYLPEREVTSDEEAIYRFIRRVSPLFAPSSRALEVGCGPTVHHAIMLAPYVSKIDMADYLEENLALVEGWRRGGPDAWDWSDYSIFCSAEDGCEPGPVSISARDELTRRIIGEIKIVNLLLDKPMGENVERYDLVGAFYCTEEIALNYAGWQEVMRALTSLIRPGGHLLMSCLANTDFYHIRAEDGSVRELPCVNITRGDIDATLDALSFSKTERSIEEYQTPDQFYEGVRGGLMVFARLDS